MFQRQSVRKLPGNEKPRIKHQRDREPNSLRQILDHEEQATQNNRNQGTAKHKNHQNKRHNHQTDTAHSIICAGIECHSLTAPLLRDKALQPCKDFIVELLSRKGRPHPPVQTDKILLTVSLRAHVPRPEKRQRRQPKCCTGNQKGTSELKTQTKLFQAPSSISKGSKLKKVYFQDPKMVVLFRRKTGDVGGASPVWDPDALFATST